jgi:hypothetical protein
MSNARLYDKGMIEGVDCGARVGGRLDASSGVAYTSSEPFIVS